MTGQCFLRPRQGFRTEPEEKRSKSAASESGSGSRVLLWRQGRRAEVLAMVCLLAASLEADF